MAGLIRSMLFRADYLVSHPGFRRSPVRVLLRAAAWEVVKRTRRTVTISIHGDCRMLLHPPRSRHGHAGLVYVFRELYEPGVLAAIDRYLLAGAVAYDIGANIGLWTLRMSRRVGQGGRVVSFEPVPATARQLEANVELSRASNVTVVAAALGDHAGSATVYFPSDAGRVSLAPESDRDTPIEVEMLTLDSVWEADGRPDVRFVKIDIEGAEPLMLAGAANLLTTARPVVACELNPVKLERLGFTAADVMSVFRDLGYTALAWDDRTADFVPAPDAREGDILFLPE